MAGVDYTGFLGVTAFTSDASLDFLKGDPVSAAYVLTVPQCVYLKENGVAAEGGVVVPKQVHGDVIWQVSFRDIPQAGIVEADAVVTNVPGLPVAIRTADCLPALMHDPVRCVIAAVHAGWKSTRLEIVRKTVELLHAAYGVSPGDIRVAIGPCIRLASCAVGVEFKDYFPEETIQTPEGLKFDIVRANVRQLTQAGVLARNISDCGFDSFADAKRFHSFRRDADKSGRMISVIQL